MIKAFGKKEPKIHKSAFISPTAVLIGDITILEDSSVWYNCVLRGDEHPILIGKRTNIQDITMCHETGAIGPLIIGDDVTIGHGSIIHGCSIGNNCLIGMGAVIMDRAKIGEGSIVAAGAVILEGTIIPPRSLVAGVPGKVRREVSDLDLQMIFSSAIHYVENSAKHKKLFGSD